MMLLWTAQSKLGFNQSQGRMRANVNKVLINIIIIIVIVIIAIVIIAIVNIFIIIVVVTTIFNAIVKIFIIPMKVGELGTVIHETSRILERRYGHHQHLSASS